MQANKQNSNEKPKTTESVDETLDAFITRMRLDHDLDILQIAAFLQNWAKKPLTAELDNDLFAYMALVHWKSGKNWKSFSEADWKLIRQTDSALAYRMGSNLKFIMSNRTNKETEKKSPLSFITKMDQE